MCPCYELSKAWVRPDKTIRRVFYRPAYSTGGKCTAPFCHELNKFVGTLDSDTVRHLTKILEARDELEVSQRQRGSFAFDLTGSAKSPARRGPVNPQNVCVVQESLEEGTSPSSANHRI